MPQAELPQIPEFQRSQGRVRVKKLLKNKIMPKLNKPKLNKSQNPLP